MTDLAPVGDRAEVEQSIESKLEEMAPLKEQFLDATVGYLRAWMWQESDRAITREPERAVRLGKRRLKRFRKKLAKLERRLPKIVRKRVGKKEFWAHESSAPEEMLNIKGGAGFQNPYRVTRDPIPRLFQESFGQVLTRLGRTHRKYKLGRARWRKSRTVGGMLDFRGTVEPSEEMKEALGSYADAADDLRAALQRLEEMKDEELRRAAAELWDVDGR